MMLWTMCLEKDGTFPWSKIECVNTNLTSTNICDDGVHPNASGIQLQVENLMGYFSKNGLTTSTAEIKPWKIVCKPQDV